MHIDPQFGDVLGKLYEGPLEDPPWQSFLSVLRTLLGADLVTLLLRPPSLEDQAVMLADGGSLSAIRSYNEGQFVLDPFVNLPSRQVFSLQQYLGRDALQGSDFYRVVMAPQGWLDFLGADVREEGELDLRVRAGRYRGAEPFAEREKVLLAALLPHLERSVRLQTRISRTERERAVYAGAVAQLQVATFILDEQLRVLSLNDAAQALVERGEGIRVVERRLQLADRQAATELETLLASVLRARQGGHAGAAMAVQALAMQVPRGGQTELGLVARAVPKASAVEGRGMPSIAVFVSDPAQDAQPPQQVVRRLFGLTPTEAQLSLLLSRGLSLDEAATELDISRNTARAHLRAVFAKTGVSRQAGLVRLILHSVAPLAGEAPSGE